MTMNHEPPPVDRLELVGSCILLAAFLFLALFG